MKARGSWCCLLLLVFSGCSYSFGATDPDSLIQLLKRTESDTQKVNLLNEIGTWYLDRDNAAKAIEFGKQALVKANECGFDKGASSSYLVLAGAERFTANYPSAILYLQKAIELKTTCKDRKGVGSCYAKLGATYMDLADYARSVEWHFKALKIREELKDSAGIAYSLNNIGLIFDYQGNFSEALKYFNRSLGIRLRIGDKAPLSQSYNNIGVTYQKMKDFVKAEEFFRKGLVIQMELGKKQQIAFSYGNIGNNYYHQKKYKEAEEFFIKSKNIALELSNTKTLSMTLLNLANVYEKLGRGEDALKNGTACLEIAERIGAQEVIEGAHQSLSNVYSLIGDNKNALYHYKRYVAVRDTIFSKESTKKILRAEVNFQFEKKEQQSKLEQEKKEAVHKAELDKQTFQRNAFMGGFALVLLLAGVSYRSYRNQRKAHALLEIKNNIIEEKNKDITDSINYAKQIQQAILPFSDRISNALPQHFILYKPKDIVSGDFYWFFERGEKIFLAVVDCTGHGVPGAFMSMVGSAALNHIVSDKEFYRADEILNEMNKDIRSALKQEETNNRDGMDLSLCVIDRSRRVVEFAGAMNSLYYISQGELHQVKGNRFCIGGDQGESERLFTLHEVPYKEDDVFYITSDGYADQFGGEKGKKFRESNLKKLLQEIHSHPMQDQQRKLDETFQNWRGNLEQVDDVCLFGFRVNK